MQGEDSSFVPLPNAELYDPVSGTWTATGSLNSAHAVHTATLLENGSVLVAGGFVNLVQISATTELYDPASGTWTTTNRLLRRRAEHTATLLQNGTVLIAGGSGGHHTTFSSAELGTVHLGHAENWGGTH